MFGRLKQKLKEFTDSVTKKVDEKAVIVEDIESEPESGSDSGLPVSDEIEKTDEITTSQIKQAESSEIDDLSVASEISEIDKMSVASEISEIGEMSVASEIPKASVASETSEISKTSAASEISDISKVSVASETSEISKTSVASETSEISKTSVASETSEISKTSVASETSEISKAFVASETSEISELGESTKLNESTESIESAVAESEVSIGAAASGFTESIESTESSDETQKIEKAAPKVKTKDNSFMSKFKNIFSGKSQTTKKGEADKTDKKEKIDKETDLVIRSDIETDIETDIGTETIKAIESDVEVQKETAIKSDTEAGIKKEAEDSKTKLEKTESQLKSEKPAAVSAETAASSSKKTKKAGFFDKAKALFNREVILDEKDLEEPLFELEMALLESDLALSVCEAIINSVREELIGTHKKIGKNSSQFIEDALKKSILNVMSANVFDFDEYIKNKEGKTIHLAFVGINGTGKTTSVAKLAHRFKKQGYSVVLAAGDTFRAGAIDQIQIHADRLGVKLIRHHEGSDPAAVIYDALQYAKSHNIDILLSDTAGRMHTNLNLMSQLEKICRVSNPDLVIFVDEATAGNDAVERARQFSEAVEIDGSILTKLDADSKGGAAISIAYITQKPILFFGMGQEYDDLMKFDPEWFVNKLFED